MNMRTETASLGLFGVGGAWGSFLVSQYAYQGLSIAVLLVGLVTGVYSLFALRRINRLAEADAKLHLCKECTDGTEPTICPLPLNERPRNCPKRMAEEGRK